MLAACFGNTPEFWMNLQVTYDLRAARAAHGRALARIRPFATRRAKARTG
jgi:plasmid maintenance system antidote protein VapI